MWSLELISPLKTTYSWLNVVSHTRTTSRVKPWIVSNILSLEENGRRMVRTSKKWNEEFKRKMEFFLDENKILHSGNETKFLVFSSLWVLNEVLWIYRSRFLNLVTECMGWRGMIGLDRGDYPLFRLDPSCYRVCNSIKRAC